MSRRDRLCFTVQLCALGVWAGVLAMTAAAAAVTFPAVKRIDPTVLSLPEASRPHWMFVAGKVVNGVFTISHIAQAVCAVLALASLVALVRSPERKRELRIATVATAGSVALLASYLLLLWPRMKTNLHTYWDKLIAGDVPAAKAAQDLFNADHPRASTMLQILLLLVLVALVITAWKATHHHEARQ